MEKDEKQTTEISGENAEEKLIQKQTKYDKNIKNVSIKADAKQSPDAVVLRNGIDKDVDSGWSWMVLLGVFYIMTVNPFLAPSFGIMFKEYIEQYKIPASGITWIFNIQTFVWNIFGLLVGPLCNLFGWRYVAISGCIVTSISMFATAFTSSAWHLMLSYSILSGIGGSLTTTVCLFILPHYWKKRKGFANGIMMMGSSVGLFVSPQIIRLLQDKINFKYSMMIFGSIFLVGCFAAALFRPKVSANKNKSAPPPTSFSTIGLLAFSSSLTTGVVAGLDRKSIQTANRSKCCQYFYSFTLIRHFTKAVISSFKILQYKRALIIALIAGIVFNALFNALAICPLLLRTKELSAWTISVNAVSSFVGKFGISAISDFKHFRDKKGIMGMIGIILLASSILGFSLTSEVKYQLIFMGIQGLGGGIIISLYPLIIIDILGLDKLPDTFGVASLFVAFGSITIGPLIGYIKDLSGDFNVTLQILSGLTFFGLILGLFMPLAEKYDKRTEARTLSNKNTDKEKQDFLQGSYRRSYIEEL